MKLYFSFLLLVLSLSNSIAQQNVAINDDGSAPDPKAILDVKSSTKGVLLPRMTTAQRLAIGNPPEGLMIYDTDAKSIFFSDPAGGGNTWNNVMSSDLVLPYFEGVSLNTAAFHIQNSEPSPNAVGGQFTAADGIGVYGHSGNIGGRFWGGTTGIDVIGGGGYAGKFYGGNGAGVNIDMNGDALNALVVDRGRTGLGTVTPNAKLHVRDANASNANTTGEAIFKASAYQPSIPDEMNLEYWIAQPAGGEPNEPYFGMRSNHRLNLVSNNNTSNPEISLFNNKVGINKKDGTYPLSINGKTAFYEDNTYIGEIYGDQATGDLYINAMKAISGMDGFFSKNLILQPHIEGKKAGKVGININIPTAFLEVGKGNFTGSIAAKFGNSKFDMDTKNSTSISGGNSDANVANRGELALNADVTAPVKIATGGGNVFMSHPDTKLSIGTEVNTHTLNVNGTIRSTELIVESGWADYVFNPDYTLIPIDEVEKFVLENHHLPNIPKGTTIQNEGLKVSEISTKMMEKIEEMMLYIIEQNKQIKRLQDEVSLLKNKK